MLFKVPIKTFIDLSTGIEGYKFTTPHETCTSPWYFSQVFTSFANVYELMWHSLTLSWRRPLSYRNQWTGFYMITASVMRELKPPVYISHWGVFFRFPVIFPAFITPYVLLSNFLSFLNLASSFWIVFNRVAVGHNLLHLTSQFVLKFS